MVATWDWVGVLGVSLISTFVTEFALWLTIYRHQSFQSLRVNLARQAKKLEEIKAIPVTAAKLKSKQKKENKLEMTMRNDCTREFTTMKMKQSVGTMMIVFATYRVMTNSYDGKMVAKLPFVPFPLLSKLTNRGLGELNDMTACAWTFIFTLCQMGLRPTIAKALDLGPSRQMLGLSSVSAAGERGAEAMMKN